ncbi:MAG: 3-hydroxyacyl-CoA dehydrogenase NAD-binding domain-containing protein [Cyclobacteriaceae bacterium]
MEKIGVLGAGAMGSGIAQVAATAGHEVIIYDTYRLAMDSARAGHKKIINRLVEKGKFSEAKGKGILERIRYRESLHDFKDCSMIIEAVKEDLAIKKDVFEKLEKIASNECILGSNTSSLSIASVAAACSNPERVLGVHFFNPAPLMPLVEIIPAIQSKPELVAKAKAMVDSWGKVTVLAKDTPGFIVNRVARPFYGESLRIYEEGMADCPTIDWALKEIGGFKMGPFELMDFIGNDINYTVTETVFKSFFFDPRYKPAFTQKRMHEAGLLGRKTGKGYYNYEPEAVAPEPNMDDALGNQIVDRVVSMLINEAADALFWQIASIEDLETAMTKGVNYPKGLLKWADEIGIHKCVEAMDKLYNEYREDRYRCSPLLRRMSKSGDTFF